MNTPHPLPLDQDQRLEDTAPKGSALRTAIRVAKHASRRLIVVLLTIFVGTFLMLAAANGGGVIDKAERDRTRVEMLRDRPDYYVLPAAERDELWAHWQEQEGLNLPFIRRHLRWTLQALALDWGQVTNRQPFSTMFVPVSQLADGRTVLLQHLPNTMLLIGTAFFLLFIVGGPLALRMSQHPGGRLDRLMGLLTPLSSIPAWVIGFLLIIVFAVGLRILPAGRMTDTVPAESTWDHVSMVGRHMVLPVVAILVSLAFTLVFTWRTFFVTYGDEDYVDVGRAKGLSNRRFRANYILRPVLPSIITSFSLALVGIWQMVTTVEFVFDWPGIGGLFVKALPNYLQDRFFPGDPAILIGTMVIFAYIFGLTVFLLDFVYVLVDPRLRIGDEAGTLRPARAAQTGPRWRWRWPRGLRLSLPHFRWPEDPRAALRRMRSDWRADLRPAGMVSDPSRKKSAGIHRPSLDSDWCRF